jgi:hypothetical protein
MTARTPDSLTQLRVPQCLPRSRLPAAGCLDASQPPALLAPVGSADFVRVRLGNVQLGTQAARTYPSTHLSI